MRPLKVLAVCCAVVPSLAHGGMFAKGIGTFGCDMLPGVRNSEAMRLQVFQWFAGYASARNLLAHGSGEYRDLTTITPELVMSYLEIKCSQNPGSMLAVAMVDAYFGLPLKRLSD